MPLRIPYAPVPGIRASLRSGTVRTFATNIGILGLGLITSIQLARWLGPVGRGELAIAMLWPGLLVLIFGLGLPSATVYFAASSNARVEHVFGTVLGLAAAQSFVATGLGYVLLPLILQRSGPGVIGLSRLFLTFVPFNLFVQCSLGLLQARMNFTALNLLRFALPGSYALGVVALRLSAALSVRNVLLLLVFLNATLALACVPILGKQFLGRLRAERQLAKSMIKYGLQVQLGDASQMLNLRLDQALISVFLPARELGLYVVAVSVSSVVQALPAAVRTVLTPRIAAADSLERRLVLIRNGFRRFVGVSVLGSALLIAILPIGLPLVYTPMFMPALVPARILVIAAVFFGGKEVLAGAAQGIGAPMLSARAELAGVVVTVCALALFLPPWGITGAAIASLIAYACQFVVLARGLARWAKVSVGYLLLRDDLDSGALRNT